MRILAIVDMGAVALVSHQAGLKIVDGCMSTKQTAAMMPHSVINANDLQGIKRFTKCICFVALFPSLAAVSSVGKTRGWTGSFFKQRQMNAKWIAATGLQTTHSHMNQVSSRLKMLMGQMWLSLVTMAQAITAWH